MSIQSSPPPSKTHNIKEITVVSKLRYLLQQETVFFYMEYMFLGEFIPNSPTYSNKFRYHVFLWLTSDHRLWMDECLITKMSTL